MFLQSFLEMKMNDFDAKVQSMNRWMDDSEKLINSRHVEMDPNEVTKRVLQIKVGQLCRRRKRNSTLIKISPRKTAWQKLLNENDFKPYQTKFYCL